MLSIILGYTELRLSMTPATDPGRADLEEILAAARKSADLTRQLLAFARKQTIRPQVIDLNEAVQSTLKMLTRLIGEDISLEWKPGHGLWTVNIDPSQVDQLLANLAVNSRDAMPAGGRLTIGTGNQELDDEFCARHRGVMPGEYVCLAVSDTGHGMEPEALRRAFEPFFTTKAPGQGTGLGLATVYGIVKQHGGLIDVYSEPNIGTTFKIWFARHLDAAAPVKPEADHRAPQGTETVLIVEDSESLLKLGRTMLNMLGYTVLSAAHLHEAIELTERYDEPIDLLVTDVVMPDLNGKELAARLTVARPGLRCLFMSGYTANVIAPHGVLDEGVHFVQKPFSLATLAAGVRNALDGTIL
jgi:CheY-like chemotaxis protein